MAQEIAQDLNFVDGAKVVNLDVAQAIKIDGKLNYKSITTPTVGQQKLATALACRGRMLYKDPYFAKSFNAVNTYNNLGNGNVQISRIASPVGTPSDSGFCLEIKHIGEASPGLGGFYFGNIVRSNATFALRFKAKIPLNCTLAFATNAVGVDGNLDWLTSNIGTGKWEEYVYCVTTGETGAFSNTNFICITYDNGSTPSALSPLVWYLCMATVYDLDSDEHPKTKVVSFQANGTWIKPDTCTMIEVVCIGSGGGGGSGCITATATACAGGGGGGGGGLSEFKMNSIGLPASVSIIVGVGGIGASGVSATGNGATGNAGGVSSFGSILRANGGNGGLAGAVGGGGGGTAGTGLVSGTVGGTGGNGTNGGAGSAPTLNSGASGGGGGAGLSAANAQFLGGSGGAIGIQGLTAVGGGLAGLNSFCGRIGTGGGGGSSALNGASNVGMNGGLYGGGGGGSGANRTGGTTGKGGNGANGIVYVIEYY